MGLPQVQNTKDAPGCSGVPGTRPCLRKDLLKDMARRPPIYLPYTTPVYSNLGFAVLSLVVEGATKRSFKDVAQTEIFDVVGMTSTSFDGFPDNFSENGFVAVGEPTWNSTLGVYEA